MEQLSEEFIAKYFFTYAESPRYNRGLGTYQGGCPICHEGKSWKKKQRCYYIPKDNRIFCHNCGFSNYPIVWISQVTGRGTKEIWKEYKEYSMDLNVAFSGSNLSSSKPVERKPIALPFDAFDLSDQNIIQRYRSMGRTDFDPALKEIIRRKLDRAINKGKLYFSFEDYSHSHRLIIPFYDNYGKLTYFQSRALDNKSERYISSGGYDKTVYGIERLDYEKPYIFILEGPLDTFFLKNAVAVGGITESSNKLFTPVQERQLNECFGMKRIWVLDNPTVDPPAAEKIKILEDMGESYLIWPTTPEFSKIKDLNDLCIATDTVEVKEDFIIKNSKIFD